MVNLLYFCSAGRMRESLLGSSILFHTDLLISFPKNLPRLNLAKTSVCLLFS